MKYYNYPNGTKTAEALDSENTAVVKGPDGKYIAPNELPAITAQDAGKVVKVNAAGTGLEYGEAGGGGGSGLPAVTSSDNGKVLGVVNGEWAKTDVPYTHSTILFSGTAEVEELYAPK